MTWFILFSTSCRFVEIFRGNVEREQIVEFVALFIFILNGALVLIWSHNWSQKLATFFKVFICSHLVPLVLHVLGTAVEALSWVARVDNGAGDDEIAAGLFAARSVVFLHFFGRVVVAVALNVEIAILVTVILLDLLEFKIDVLRVNCSLLQSCRPNWYSWRGTTSLLESIKQLFLPSLILSLLGSLALILGSSSQSLSPALQSSIRARDRELGHGSVQLSAIVLLLAALGLNGRLVDLVALLEHLAWQDVLALLLPELVELICVLALKIEHVVKPGVVHARPAHYFDPVGKVAAVRVGRDGVVLVDSLQLLLGGQCGLHQVRVETAEAKDEDGEENCDERANETGPVLFHHLTEDFRSAVIKIRVILQLLVVNDHVGDAHRCEQHDC